MKIQACVIGGPAALKAAFSAPEFATSVLVLVVKDIFKVEDVFERPAEYHVEDAAHGPNPEPDLVGIELRVTGVSRNKRTPKQFHRALSTLEDLVEATACRVLANEGPRVRCQVFCVLELDGEVETAPGSGEYSRALEGTAFFAGER